MWGFDTISGLRHLLGVLEQMYALQVRGTTCKLMWWEWRLKIVRNLSPWGLSVFWLRLLQSLWISYLCTFTTHKYGVWLSRWLFSRQWWTCRGPRRLQAETTYTGEINRGQIEEKGRYFQLEWKTMEVIVSLSSLSDSKLPSHCSVQLCGNIPIILHE